MIHNDLALLKPAMQTRASAALEEMRNDRILKEFGVTSMGILETLREPTVQMAYRSRLLWTELRDTIQPESRDTAKRTIAAYVQAMYKAAGLYIISSSDALVPVTWTLDSKHLRGEAIDIVPQRNGNAWWLPKDSPVWTRMGEIGEKHSLSWGGRWKNTDSPHFEI